MRLYERIARREAAHHFGTRYGRPLNDPDVEACADENWRLWEDVAQRAVDVMREAGALKICEEVQA